MILFGVGAESVAAHRYVSDPKRTAYAAVVRVRHGGKGRRFSSRLRLPPSSLAAGGDVLRPASSPATPREEPADRLTRTTFRPETV